jgi:uncharacterized protein
MQCPRDATELEPETYEGEVVVDRCRSCDGIWLDRGELESIQSTIEHDYSEQLAGVNVVAKAYELARQKARPVVNCPSCGSSMHAEEYAYCSLILVDRCVKCGGIWLDSGELQALERFFEREADVHRGVRKGFFGGLLRAFS